MHYEILETRKKEKALLQQQSSPPKADRLPSNGIKPNRSPATSQSVNGTFDEFHNYSDLEFLGPATEFDGQDDSREGEDGWPVNLGEEQGMYCQVLYRDR